MHGSATEIGRQWLRELFSGGIAGQAGGTGTE
jgi:hypothetical protein